MSKTWALPLTVVFILISHLCWALETDQYTLPPTPLVDIGPEVSGLLLETLSEIAKDPAINPLTAALAFERKWGRGDPTTHLETWLNKNPAGFHVKKKDSIYRGIPSTVPFALSYLAPTINLYGVYFGTDKLGHFAQQGFGYFKSYLKMREQGFSMSEAQSRAVKMGVWEERTVYGAVLDGVYSNGDLAGNFIGLKFYINFFEPVQIGSQTVPPIFLRQESKIYLNPLRNNGDLLRPYITEHLNEALNPSLYVFREKKIVENIKARCSLWKERLPDLKDPLQLNTFFGEDYGHSKGFSKGSIPMLPSPLSELCR